MFIKINSYMRIIYFMCVVVSCFRYGTVSRRNFKARYNLKGLVEDHHIIPKQWRKHYILLDNGYDVAESYNIMMMPNEEGKNVLNTKRLVHSGGHKKYNEYVKEKLSEVKSVEQLHDLVRHLRRNMRGNPDDIPWR